MSRHKYFWFDSRSPRQQNYKLIRFFVSFRVTFFQKPYFMFILDLNDFDLWLCLHSQQMKKSNHSTVVRVLFPSLSVVAFRCTIRPTKNYITFHKKKFMCDQCPMLFIFRYKNTTDQATPWIFISFFFFPRPHFSLCVSGLYLHGKKRVRKKCKSVHLW